MDDTLHEHRTCFGCLLKLEVQDCKFVKKKTKWRISKRVLQENKANKMFQKTNISYPVLCFLVSLILIFTFLPYYRRTNYGFLFVYL